CSASPCSATCRTPRPSWARRSSSPPGSTSSCASASSGTRKRRSIRRRSLSSRASEARPGTHYHRCQLICEARATARRHKSAGGNGSPPSRGRQCDFEARYRTFFVELAQFFSDDQTPRERRKQSTGLEEPSASKRCSSTPVHWKPHFSRMLRDLGLATRAPAISVSWSNSSKK